MVSAYRSDEGVLEKLVYQMLVEREREVAGLDRTMRALLVQRMARAAAGAVGIGAGLLFWGVAIKSALKPTKAWYTVGEATDGRLVELLVGAWMTMGIAYVLGRLVGHALRRRALERVPHLSGRAHVDLERLQNAPPHRPAIELMNRLFAPSFGWLLAAMGLLLPVTLHLVVWMAWSWGPSLTDFDEWIKLSATCVGPAHLVLAGCYLRLGRRLGRDRDASPATIATAEGLKAQLLTLLAAFVPGLVCWTWPLLVIPPLITAVTGVAVIPLTCCVAASRAAAERRVLRLAPSAV
jgi:hypothetical protein